MISVVMPAYNASQFIAEAIESILNQTFKEFELIIIDDGSTDNTVAIVEHYQESDKRIKLIKNQHGGICKALSSGIEVSSYPWIARMDADDISLPQRFAKQLEAANANPRVVVWGTYANHINSKGKVLSFVQQGCLTEEEFQKNRQEGHIPFVIHPTAFIRKDILVKIRGYNSKFFPAEDMDLFDRMANYGPILAIPEPLLLYRIHSSSVSMSNFFFQKLLARYVVARHRTKLAGQEKLKLEKFIEEYQNQPILSRLARQKRTLGQFWYRKAGLFFAEEQYFQTWLYLGMSFVANPSYSITRIWRQKLSPEARRVPKG